MQRSVAQVVFMEDKQYIVTNCQCHESESSIDHAAARVVLPLPAGEGAHATFAPRGWKQRALQVFAEAKLGGHVEVEQVRAW